MNLKWSDLAQLPNKACVAWIRILFNGKYILQRRNRIIRESWLKRLMFITRFY